MKWGPVLLETFTDSLLIALPADLLYLYYAGGWREPNEYILCLELASLMAAVLLGTWRIVSFVEKSR